MASARFCGGLLFHSAVDNTTAPVTEGHLIFALLDDALERRCEQAPVFHRTLQRQVLGQPFLNTGTRLLIYASFCCWKPVPVQIVQFTALRRVCHVCTYTIFTARVDGLAAGQ